MYFNTMELVMHKDLERNNHYLGKRYGKLVILEIIYVQDRTRTRRNVRCKCDCGNEKIIRLNNLLTGATISCGCHNLERIRGPQGESGFNALYTNYSRLAKKREIEFELTKEEFRNLVTRNCKYCGTEPKQKFWIHGKGLNQTKEHSTFIYNGIDRVDSSKNYTIDNCVPCCGICNMAKNERTLEEFQDWIDRLCEFNSKK